MSNRTLIARSNTYPGDSATVPFNIALYRLDGNDVTPWVTWMVLPQGVTSQGHYAGTLREAVKDYYDRCAKHDLDPEGGK